MTELQVVDTETGEYLAVGERSLDEIAESFRKNLDASEDLRLQAGLDLAQAWEKCASPDCGIEGDNQKARYGLWVSANFSDTETRTLHNLRRRYEVFGTRQDEMKGIGIGVSSQYLLASEGFDDVREIIIDGVKERVELEGLDKASGKLIDEVIKKHDIRENHRALGTGENEWYTPDQYIKAAKKVMGAINLDPATSEKANKVVGAENIFTEADNGLEQEWFGSVWMNPPYAQPHIADFCEKLAQEYSAGRVEQAIALTHNYTDTKWFHGLASVASAICFTRGRIGFVSPTGEKAAPTQGQAFFYLGDDVFSFNESFSEIGIVMVNANA